MINKVIIIININKKVFNIDHTNESKILKIIRYVYYIIIMFYDHM